METTPASRAAESALLDEADWIRRLARRLVRDADAAEDLTQEVLTTAIVEEPALSGGRLRGWLAGVARHLAARRRLREFRRVDAERRASRDELDGEVAHERLLLQRRLTEAVDALPEPYRTTLVLRFFDDLAPRAIARRQGLPATTVRKRVSRGLAMLRGRLDDEFAVGGSDGRSEWSLALVGCLRRRGVLEGLPATGVFTMSSLAKVTTLSALALSAVGLAVLVRGALVPDPGPEPPEPAGLRPPEGMDGTSWSTASVPSVPGATRTTAAAPVEPALPVRRLRVVGPGGEPLPDARVAGVDDKEELHPLTLDGEGGTAIPDELVGGRIFAARDGLAPGFIDVVEAPREAEDAGDAGDMGDVVLALDASVELRGVALEDGGPPSEPLPLLFYWEAATTGMVYDMNRPLAAALSDGRFCETSTVAWTDLAGAFRVTGLPAGARGRLYLPPSHVLADVARHEDAGTGRVLAVDVADGFLTLELDRLPLVEGRLVWADDGAPVEAASYDYSAMAPDGQTTALYAADCLSEDGRFRLGVPVADWRHLSPAERSAAMDDLVELHLWVSAKGADHASYRFSLRGVDYPLDVGTISLQRASGLHVRVLGADGLPLAGAIVATAAAVGETDASGELRLARLGDPDGEALVLAPGHALGRFPVAERSGAPWTVELEPGIELRVVIRGPDGGLPADVLLEAEWEQSPFENAGLGHVGLRLLAQELRGGRNANHLWRSDSPVGHGFGTFEPDDEGVVGLRALLPDVPLRLRVVHRRGGALVEREVVTPSAPGIRVIRMDFPREAAGAEQPRLCGRVLDEDGAGIPNAQVTFQRGLRWVSLGVDETGAFESGPLEAGSLSIRVRATGFVDRPGLEVAVRPGMPPLDVTLERARTLALLVREESGRTLQIESARALGADRRAYGPRQYGSHPTPGRRVFESVPSAPLELRIRVGLEEYDLAVEEDALEATLVLPDHASLAAEVTRATLGPAEADLVLRVSALDGSARTERELWILAGAEGPFPISMDLLAGTYRAELLARTDSEAEGRDAVEVPLMPAREVTLRAGETTRIVL